MRGVQIGIFSVFPIHINRMSDKISDKHPNYGIQKIIEFFLTQNNLPISYIADFPRAGEVKIKKSRPKGTKLHAPRYHPNSCRAGFTDNGQALFNTDGVIFPSATTHYSDISIYTKNAVTSLPLLQNEYSIRTLSENALSP